MKGQTNAKLASKGIPGESVNITLLTNQESHSDLIGAVITVSYGGVDAEYVWEGSEVTVKIPAMMDYSISVSEVEGYATPEVFSVTSQMGYSRKLEMTYNAELVRVTLSADDSSSVNGQIVTINGEAFTYSGTAVTKKFPFGTEYTVSVNDKSDYITPATQTFTASKSVRELEMVYKEIQYGVYIQGVSGILYIPDEWSNQETVLCVSVITDNCRFGVALEDATVGNNFPHGNASGIVSLNNSGDSLTSTSDKTTALNDFNGIGNTINMKSGTSTGKGSTTALKLKSASAACRGYQFLDGRLGYEGSAGEWGIISDNLESINYALSVCGGKPINGYYATSTKGGNYDGWCFTSSNKSLSLSTSSKSVLARALCRLVFDENIKSVLFGCKYYTGSNYATILFECKPGDYFEDWVKSEYNVSGGNISTWGDVVVLQSYGWPYSGKITLTNSYSQSPIGTNFVYDGEFTEL